jgi:hypothetical protein
MLPPPGDKPSQVMVA